MQKPQDNLPIKNSDTMPKPSPQGEFKNHNPNQNHNTKKESLGVNTKQ